MRILLVRLSAIGDCLHAVPLAVALRERLPDASLGWAIEEEGHELLRGHPAVDRFHVYSRHGNGRGPGSWPGAARRFRDFRRELRAASYDVALDVQGLTKSGLVAWWSGARRRIGFAGPDSRELNRLFVNERQPVPPGLHVVERNLTLLRALELEPPSRPRFTLPAYDDEGRRVEASLAELGLEPGAFAIVNPGTTWITKTWPATSFAAVARGLVEELLLPVVVTWGSPAERRLAETVAAGNDGARVSSPTTLRELAALVARAALFVGNDTGPLHLAVALDVPSVGVFGATDPARNGPYGDPHRAVVATEPLDCRPCRARWCRRGDLACLHWISPAEVLVACRAAVGG
jgi:lipopolysaccharide heptosyltransferase I